jgi:hypothetical protein
MTELKGVRTIGSSLGGIHPRAWPSHHTLLSQLQYCNIELSCRVLVQLDSLSIAPFRFEHAPCATLPAVTTILYAFLCFMECTLLVEVVLVQMRICEVRRVCVRCALLMLQE